MYICSKQYTFSCRSLTTDSLQIHKHNIIHLAFGNSERGLLLSSMKDLLTSVSQFSDLVVFIDIYTLVICISNNKL